MMSAKIDFEKDAQLTDQLIVLLEREQGRLINADIEAIDVLLEEKSQLLQRISLTAQSRYEALSRAGFEASENGMTAWLQAQNIVALLQLWQDFQKSLAQAKELNRVNGLLISKHFNYNQKALNHLQGIQTSNLLYGANGQATGKVYSRGSLAV